MTRTTPIAIATGGTEERIASATVTLLVTRPYMFKANRVPIATREAALLQMVLQTIHRRCGEMLKASGQQIEEPAFG